MHRIVVSLITFVPVLAFAQNENDYRCTLDGKVRRVEIVYETGVAVPCEVHYYKETEAPGERQVLWNARNESGYCETRTRDFVAQLESWGWACTGAASREATEEVVEDAVEETIDDTDVLGAAETDDGQ